MSDLPTAFIRRRLGAEDAHYAGNLVAGAKQLEIIGDLITELAMRHDGDEGLFRAYESVEFLYPLYAGDWIEARGRIVKVGNSSRTCEFEVWKIGGLRSDVSESAAEFLDEPILTCRAKGTTVVTAESQRL
jgi:3-aminobutyryl-CoA ammonia-lyase